MSDSDTKGNDKDVPRSPLPKVGGLGRAPKPPSVPSSDEIKVTDSSEEPDLEKFSFFHWGADEEEDAEENTNDSGE